MKPDLSRKFQPDLFQSASNSTLSLQECNPDEIILGKNEDFGQFDERKSPGSSRFQITNHLDRLHVKTILFNPRLKLMFCCDMRKISYYKAVPLLHLLLYFGGNWNTRAGAANQRAVT